MTNTSAHFIELTIPQESGDELVVELIKSNVSSNDISVVLADGSSFDNKRIKGLHYRGTLRDAPTTVAAFSIFEDQIIGMISTSEGNIVLHPTDNHKRGEYIAYYDTDLKAEMPLSCSFDELIHLEVDDKSYAESRSSETPCVSVYLECDYALFLNKQSAENTVNWITAVFNNEAALYEKENIHIKLSEVFVWNVPDPYSKTSAATAINQFRNLRLSYNGDIAHLISLGGKKLGGVAWLNTLCTNYGYAFSNIHSSFEDVPVYSWTVTVIAHEMGHSFGSNHTQWCGWPDGPIDNCRNPEGQCNPGPTPQNGGTIMSYCHLVPGVGINLANGFGIHPGNRMRLRLASVNCLVIGCSGDDENLPCMTPGGLTVSNINAYSADISWQAQSGEITYTFRYRKKYTTQWTTVNSNYNQVELSGLIPSTTYEWSVKTLCSTTESSFSPINEFTTATLVASCGIPSNLKPENVTTNSADVSWTTVAGAEYYTFEYKIASSPTWYAVDVQSSNIRLNGLKDNSSYDVRVKAVCNELEGQYSIIINFKTKKTTSRYCKASAQNSTYEWINYVKFGNLVRSSLSDGGYYEGTALVASVESGETYELELRAGRTSGNYRLYWRVWIDYNGNKSFNEDGEMVLNTSTSVNELKVQIPIPSSAMPGITRIRISLKYGSQSSPCGVYTFGEVEDYTVNIKKGKNIQNDPLVSKNLEGPEDKSIEIYPNPVAESINVFCREKIIKSYTLIDHCGKVIVLNLAGTNDFTLLLPASSLISGNYFLILATDEWIGLGKYERTAQKSSQNISFDQCFEYTL